MIGDVLGHSHFQIRAPLDIGKCYVLFKHQSWWQFERHECDLPLSSYPALIETADNKLVYSPLSALVMSTVNPSIVVVQSN